MDLKRATIKALLYDFPLQGLAEMVVSPPADPLLGLEDVLKWRAKEFSKGELKGVNNLLTYEWMQNPLQPSRSSVELYPQGLINLLVNASIELLTKSASREPKVKFSKLLRWNDLSRFIGQDILVSAFVALQIAAGKRITKSYIWPTTLQHNCKSLNQLLNKGLSDLHNHLGAAWDTFDLSWIQWCNHCDVKDETLRNILECKQQDLDYIVPSADGKFQPGMRHYLNVAAIIRYYIHLLIDENKVVDNEVVNELSMVAVDSGKAQEMYVYCIGEKSSFREQKALRITDFNTAYWDYALLQSDFDRFSRYEATSPYVAFVGERRMLIHYMVRVLRGDVAACSFMPFFHLYVLIKNKLRRCFVQTNDICGLDNFQDYNSVKNKHFVIDAFRQKYIVQTSLDRRLNDYVEGRISIIELKHWVNANFRLSLFCNESYFLNQDLQNHLTFVVTLNKRNSDGNTRFGNNITKTKKDSKKIIKSTHIDHIVGLDTCGNELIAPPEVFAHAYRYMVKTQESFATKLTYHVGEDFYDLVDGLRRIDEALRFLPLKKGCRLGHAIAMGLNPLDYYQKRHFTYIAPKQIVLDNIVWLIYKSDSCGLCLTNTLRSKLLKDAEKIYNDIGYRISTGLSFSIEDYWQSMFLRADDIDVDAQDDYSAWHETSLCEDICSSVASLNDNATTIDDVYKNQVVDESNKTMEYRWDRGIVDIVVELQDKMLYDVDQRGLSIEACPTSNLLISHMTRYDEHPIFKYFQPRNNGGRNMLVSVNTDDRGIFATSLYNEYSILALALLKDEPSKYGSTHQTWHSDVMAYIENLRQMSNSLRF